jgi:hypothetical protein
MIDGESSRFTMNILDESLNVYYLVNNLVEKT